MNNKFMLAQKRKIEIEKWFEGQRLNKDPGALYVLAWIKKYAGGFRKDWENSLCKCCNSSANCGYEVRKSCDGFMKT